MQPSTKTVSSISSQEIQLSREIHDDSRHSLRLEGLGKFLSPESEADAEAWIEGVITLESAIADTLKRIRDRSRA
jgi:hypothetical protein